MSRKMTRQVRPIVGLMLASAMFCAGGVAVVAAPAPQAHAVSMSEYQAKVSNHAKLKSQLVGVSSDLADTILQLADLNDNQIPAAVEAAESAQQAAEQAQSLAEATTQRLQAAQQDKANLEEQIKQTGSDYDDAKAAVAQLVAQGGQGRQGLVMLEVQSFWILSPIRRPPTISSTRCSRRPRSREANPTRQPTRRTS